MTKHETKKTFFKESVKSSQELKTVLEKKVLPENKMTSRENILVTKKQYKNVPLVAKFYSISIMQQITPLLL